MSDDQHKLHPDPRRGVEANTRLPRFSVLWIIPVLALLIAGWLAWRHFASMGPRIVISFDAADGIVPGQTQVKNKAVTLGVVQSVSLSPDMSHADVTIQMNGIDAHMLNEHTRFWVVSPRINGASITGLDTLFSGSYIAMDPGKPGTGRFQDHFKGLENPPGVRSDKPGSTYWLVSPKLESLGPGAPIFYRDVQVGEILGYTMPPGGEGPILLKVFIKAPYDHYLRTDSRFWNVSGMQIGFGAGGMKIRLQSFQALLSGGVAFGRPDKVQGEDTPSATPDSVFHLYETQEDADNARYRHKVPVLTYVDTAVGGLTEGSKVTMFGLQVGQVTGVHLELGDKTHNPRVRVEMQLEPERVIADGTAASGRSTGLLGDFVAEGMRASVQNVSFLTGEAMIALSFVHEKGRAPAPMTFENGIAVIPSQPGGMDSILQSVSTIADKISEMPLTQIGDHLNNILEHSDERLRSPEVTRSLVALRGSLVSLNHLLDHADEHLPELMKNLNGTLAQANTLLASYGGNPDFRRNLEELIVQLTRMSRSFHMLADYLDRHPSSFITGRRP
ncbi:MlaD family protein [Bombella sp. TMW 2.2543]|uniref:MlaD family protein n=1 Tax=Bombella pluederhausensis TaxID=2967336 RepID=A0ABT3WIB1_9PROT|nr:MlaD family protein [Bombella pluederhausensis]MCX5618706.1 MlaD family protein [Bombella pluederhausensis]